MEDHEQNTGQDSSDIKGSDIPEERAIEQQIIPFMGDDLAAALAAGGNIYISLSGMCTAMGLSTQAQLRRIQRTRTLAKGLRRITIQTKGGLQRINCLRVDLVALWLAGVQTSSMKSEFRTRVEAYQEELAPIAMQVFLRIAGISLSQLVPSTDPRLTALAEQLDTLTDVTTFLREHMQAIMAEASQVTGISLKLDQAVHLLEFLVERQEDTESKVARIDARTQHLTPAHARDIQEFINQMVHQTRHAPTPLTYAMIYGRLRHRFRVGKYDEVADEKFNQVMNFLHDELRKATGGDAPEQGSLF